MFNINSLFVVVASRVHPALIVPELLLHYFKHLSDDGVARAAQVCTTWGSIAMHELWSTREVPLNALLTMLKELELLSEHGLWCWVLHHSINTKALPMERWKRFIDNYAHKVTRLCATTDMLDDACKLTHMLLTKYGGSLFPNVARLRISANNYYGLSKGILILVLGPSLVDITVEGHDDQELKILAAVADAIAPQIKRFIVRKPYKATPLVFDCGIFRNLDIVRLDDLSWRGWKMLASCEKLQDVALTAYDLSIDRTPTLTTGGDKPLFPSLRRLHIDDRMIREEILRESIMPALVHLSLTSFTSSGPTGVVSLGEVGRGSPLLKELEIGDAGGALTDIIHDMLHLSGLTCIKISGLNNIDRLSDDNMKLLMSRHLQLNTLILKPDIGLDFTGGMSINSLLALTQRCKALKHINLPLDLSDLTTNVEIQALIETPCMSVTRAAIGAVVGMISAQHTAQFLAKLLPNVAELDASDVVSPGYKKKRSRLAQEFCQYRASRHLMVVD
ncbi:hypothetical protein FRB97_008830 [Tulasnella sp. 331]|nr:hypothetical protein FRB97_008830 [Tulasnella sp. 331]